ncbi:MAG: circularly permuted type 2 ATP-grasp protein [Dermatophilaceae bacterium]
MTASPALDPRDLIADAADSMGLAGLLTARAEMRRLVQDDGIRHGQGGPLAATTPAPSATREESDGLEGPLWHLQGRNWVIDPLPVVIDAAQWRGLETGLVQRARLLDLVLRDIYGSRRLVDAGVLPPEVVLSHPGFVPQVIDADHTTRLQQSSADLGRDEDGRWTVIADRSSIGVGAGYAMATRRITSRVMASLHRRVAPARLRGFFHSMTGALLEAAPNGGRSPRAVLLSSGTGSATAYEHGFLATLLGLPLVEAEDLAMEGGRLWIRSGSRREAVDVVYRRVDSAHADPLEIRSRAGTGVPGLLEAARRGTVAVANPLGSEVIDNPALHAYLPAIARLVLGEDLLLPAVETHWCGDPAGRSHVLANLDSLVLKPVSHNTAQTTHCGWLLSAERRAELRARIEAAPWQWVGQAALSLSDEPFVASSGLEQRRFVLRTFGVARGDDVEMLTGGLGRVAPDAGTWVVPVMGSGIAKDVWVLPAEPGPEPLRLAGGRDTVAPVPLRHLTLTPRVAENLFWVGRYAERADGTTRLLRVVDDLVEDHATRSGTPGHATALAMRGLLATLTQLPVQRDESAQEHLRRLVRETGLRGSIGYAVARLVAAAQEVRDVLSHDLWHVLSRMERTVAAAAPVDEQLQPQLYDLLESTLAVSGVIAESLVRDATWGWIDAGIRMERAQHTVELLRTCLQVERSAIIEGQVAEAVLEAGESIITHRRRTVSGDGPLAPVDSAVAILLLDEANPRSVAFQAGRLAEDLRLVGADSATVVAEVGSYLGEVEVGSLDEASREDVRALLDKVAYDLRGISRELRREHFARASRPTVLASDWAPGGTA